MKGSSIMRKFVSVFAAAVLSAAVALSSPVSVYAESSTGVGLSSHALKAYYENWQYVWGGASPGAVDCSGLIMSYNGVGGNRTDMITVSSDWGYVSDGVPNIHGLGLHQRGHVGIYIGSDAAIDARDRYSDIVYHNVYSKGWKEWFKIAGVSYPNTGWVLFDSKAFYYENGQYITDTSREFDGVVYTFNHDGVSDLLPPNEAYVQTDYSDVQIGEYTYYESDDPEAEDEERQAEIDAQRQEIMEAQQQRAAENLIKAQQKKEEEELRKKEQEEKRKTSEKKRKEHEASLVYRLGNSGAKIKEFQQMLYDLKYLQKKPNGYFDEETARAITEFQIDHHMIASGITDQLLYKALKSPDVSPKPLKSEIFPGIVTVQKTETDTQGIIKPMDLSVLSALKP